MTIIDTTLYCNGELRLARHGAGKGGTVLVKVSTGGQLNVHPEAQIAVEEMLSSYDTRRIDSDYAYDQVCKYHDGFMASYRS